MIEKSLKSRITHKHDTEDNWNKNGDFIPKNAEIIVYDKDSSHNYTRIKVGDGETTVVNLPFINVFKISEDGILYN